MRIGQPGLGLYIEFLKMGLPFSFARYGDGEWNCILGRGKMQAGEQTLIVSGLRNALKKSISARDSSYYLALQSAGYLKRINLYSRIEAWITRNAPTTKWVNGEVFTKASIKGELYPLIEQLRKHQVIVVGPPHLRKLNEGVFDFVRFVQVKSKNCFTDYSKILKAIGSPKGVVISFSAGPTSKLLIAALHPRLQGESFLIDFGSLWDPYCGHCARGYHKRVKGQLLRKNLG
jgi:hypothetical protein